MDASINSFWILFSLLILGIFVMIVFFSASYLQKKRMERRLDQVFFEVRELNMRVVVVETRLEERSSIPSLPNHPIAEIPSTPVRRGRPKKVVAEK